MSPSSVSHTEVSLLYLLYRNASARGNICASPMFTVQMRDSVVLVRQGSVAQDDRSLA